MGKPQGFIAITHPHLKNEFLYCLTPDGKRDDVITWNTLRPTSSRRAMWKCPKTNCDNNCEHIYETKVFYRTNGSGCPICSGRKICPCNSFQAKYPEIVKEFWDFDANVGVDPSIIPCQSRKQFHFKCKRAKCDHHKWVAYSYQLLNGHQGCPFCAQTPRKFCKCYCLMSEHKELIETEWHPTKNANLDVYSLAPKSRTPAWWICKECKHEWNTQIRNRTNNGKHGCLKCAKSKMEQAMMKLLQDLEKQSKIKLLQPQWRMPNSSLRFDFSFTTPNCEIICLEMDGQQHFEPVTFGCKSKTKDEIFAAVVARDARKKEWCDAHNVRLLRISYLVKTEHYEAIVKEFIEADNVTFRLVGKPQM